MSFSSTVRFFFPLRFSFRNLGSKSVTTTLPVSATFSESQLAKEPPPPPISKHFQPTPKPSDSAMDRLFGSCISWRLLNLLSVSWTYELSKVYSDKKYRHPFLCPSVIPLKRITRVHVGTY